ncbi:ATP-binding cassette domain-containing protein [Dysosmobacter sp. NSJ-60]|nr:ATP-binding cassette domain-containing protein [Dysosmobacter hominis]MBS5658371.1 ATP-binding cassette domain-containing protein [Oscillibacter sp.]
MLHAVDDINIQIQKGQTLGVVGESGCGKSTLGRAVLRLIEPSSGEVLYNGENILKYGSKKMQDIRKEMQIIFQDPYASLNPRMSVSELIAEPMKVCKILKTKKELEDRVFELMDIVGLAERFVNAYPHELDGGRRQRIGIARALALDPKFIVCDEPVSALDVSIQAQILNLMMDLQESHDLTYMFITHDLSVVKHISTDIAVMYLGQMVEKAPSEELFANPCNPYTKALLEAIPIASINRRGIKSTIKGEVSNPINPKPGCRFAARCPYATAACTERPYELKEISKNHFVSCVLFD